MKSRSLVLVADYLFLAFTAITMAVVLVPFCPSFFPPIPGLESWVLGMSEAVANKMAIGRDIIFTYGPYASVSTRFYHPGTDHLMFAACVFLALAHTLIFNALSRTFTRKSVLSIVLLLLIFRVQDFLFLFYPLLVAIYAATLKEDSTTASGWIKLEMTVVFSALGMLPLIKGSFLLLVIIALLPVVVLFFFRHYYQYLLIALLAPVVGMLFFWVASGQSLSLLPTFFLSIFPIISGYTEAMALDLGDFSEVVVFLAGAVFILAAWFFKNSFPAEEKYVISIILAVFLFVAFKAGFVRHDDHVLTAMQALVGAVLILCMLKPAKSSWLVFSFTVLSYVGIIQTHVPTSLATSVTNLAFEVRDTYLNAWSGLKLRLSDDTDFSQQYAATLAEIATKYSLPKLEGTADIFSYNQAEIFASGAKWHPRPVFQSYSVYSKELALKNEQHFRNSNAPEQVVFRFQPIDSRLPAMEDGAAWMALTDNYFPEKITDTAVYLKRKAIIKATGTPEPLYEGSHHLGEVVTVPQHNDPVYAEITIKPTLLGKFIALLYKPSQLRMKLTLVDGEQRQYRVLSNMMQSPFLLSPLVDNIRSFTFLVSGKQQVIQNLMVKSFVIDSLDSRNIFWQSVYEIKFKQYKKEGQDALPSGMFNNKVNVLPTGIKLTNAGSCDGFIDAFYGFSPAASITNTVGAIGLQGWLAKSAPSGIGVDEIFVLLSSLTGKSYFIKANRSARDDVKAYFKQPLMQDLGYQVDFDVRELEGNYTLKLAFAHSGAFYECNNMQFPVAIKMSKH